MQGQYPPRAPGIAAGQSARTTTATYFDYQGILRTAQPGELRPNFVYQNGVWVQDGYLREGAATNSYSPVNVSVADSRFGNIIPVTKNETSSAFSPDVEGHPDAAMVFRVFMKKGDSSSVSFWWGAHSGRPILNIDLALGAITGNTSYYSASIADAGEGWREFVAHFGSNAADGYYPPWFVGTGYYAACPQVEAGSVPSSWIPYGQTRGAD